MIDLQSKLNEIESKYNPKMQINETRELLNEFATSVTHCFGDMLSNNYSKEEMESYLQQMVDLKCSTSLFSTFLEEMKRDILGKKKQVEFWTKRRESWMSRIQYLYDVVFMWEESQDMELFC
jgi:hypothetical protein